MASARLSTTLVTALAPAIWGTTYVVTTELLPPGRPLLAAALRALPAGLLLTALGGRLPTKGWWLKTTVLGALNFGVFFTLLFTAAYRLPGGVAATLGAAQPLIVTLAGVVVIGRVPSAAAATAALTGLGGVALVVLGPSASLDALGTAAGLGGAVSMALGTLLVQRFGRPVPLAAFAGWQLTAGGLMLLPIALVVEGLPSELTLANVAGFAYLTVLGGVVAYLLWFRGIERLGASSATFLALLSPVVATVVSFVQGNGLTVVQVAGMAVVFASVVAGTRVTAARGTALPRVEVRPSASALAVTK